MASKKENIKALFSNTRTRTIIVFTAVVLLFMVVFGVVKWMRMTSSPSLDEATRLKGAPSRIKSIPGSVNQTAQYAALQEEQNVKQAEQAVKTGSSAIPTIIRTQAFGEGVELVGVKAGEGGVGFTALALADEAGAQRSLWIQELEKNRCDVQTVKHAVSQGAVIADVYPTCSCVQLKDSGFLLPELNTVCSCLELKTMGFGAGDLKTIGYTANQLKKCGFSACETRGAGFSAEEMSAAGFSEDELKGAGFSDVMIARAGGIPAGLSADQIRQKGCDPLALANLRQQGVSAAAIVRLSGCNLSQLKMAGFSGSDLKAAGFSAAELKQAGFSAESLAQAGFSVDELKAAGFSATELKNAGIDPKALKAAGFSAAELKAAGVSPELLKALGFSTKDLASISSCTPEDLRAAKAKGLSIEDIRKQFGCDLLALKAAGFSAKELKAAGFSAAELKQGGFSLDELKALGFSAADLKAAGFSAADLKAAGFSAKELKTAGFSAAQLKSAGFSVDDLKSAGFSAKALKDAGFSAFELKRLGWDAQALKDAGFSANELKMAGFEAKQLTTAGFSDEELKAAGLAPTMIAATPAAAGSTPFGGGDTIGGGVSPFGSATVKSGKGSNADELETLMKRQQAQAKDQKYQAALKQKTALMLGAAKESLGRWKKAPTQVMVVGTQKTDKSAANNGSATAAAVSQATAGSSSADQGLNGQGPLVIKTGDIIFAVMDTSVNTDEPGPILASVVSGKLKGSKLIGSFTLPSNGSKVVITFNTMSVPGIDKTIGINAYAIDPNTARTALSSQTNHHYLQRYGALFASSFMAGMSTAIQSQDTTVSIGGTGGTTSTTVSTLSRSTLDNALIALGEVGQSWSQEAQKQMNRPTTVEVFAGTGMGILFTQDVTL